MSILTRFSLGGKNALVTGAGSGIGRALAEGLAEAGADVAAVDLDLDSAVATASVVEGLGRRSLALSVDVTQAEAVEDMVQRVAAAWGRLDIGVNNAGIALRGDAETMAEADWDAVIDVNLKGVFLCCQAEGRLMLRQGHGAIINTASMSGRIVNRPQNQVNYNASKGGVLQVTRSCAAEWAAGGVRVNSISPGHTVTPMTAKAGEAMRTQWRANAPMGRLGTPQDYQGAVVFLASEAAAYVTGHDLVVDGGYTVW